MLIPFLRAAGYRFRPRWDFRNTGLGKTFRLAKWTLGFVLVSQAALVVISRLATGATVRGSGAGLFAYFNAHAVWILPHSLITVSLATAMLPAASRLAAAGDRAGVAAEVSHAIRLALTALLPAAVGFLVLGLPISYLAFGFGRGAQDAGFVGSALMALAVGLVPFTVQYLCLRAFYALELNRTTFFLQCLIAGSNVVFATTVVFLLDRPSLVATGLAGSYSAAYLIGVMVSFRRLRRELPDLSSEAVVRHCVRLLLAVAPAAAAAWLICWALTLWSDTKLVLGLSLALAGLVAVTLFVIMARLLKITEVTEIISALFRRRGPGRAAALRQSLSEGRTAPRPPCHPPKSILRRPAIRNRGWTRRVTPSRHGPGRRGPAGQRRTGRTVRRCPPAGGHGAGHPLPARGADRGVRADRDLASLRPGAVPLGAGASAAAHRAGRATTTSPATLICSPRPVRPRWRPTRASSACWMRCTSSDPELGSYIVCEYATGQSLDVILSHAPLSGLEAAWVVREVASALAGVHSLGLYHRRINPDTVIITPAGNVKIMGLMIEAALRPAGSVVVHGADTPELVDVTDLGRLLYACLVSRWPGGPAYSLPDAPVLGRRWATPRQVRAGVSPALDQVCDQILGDPPRHRLPAITTAPDVVAALTKVLGQRGCLRGPGAPAAPADPPGRRTRGAGRSHPRRGGRGE